MSAALLSLGERAAQGLGRGELSQVYIEGDAGTVFLVSADDEAVLVAVAAKGAKVGMMLFEVRRTAAAVAEALRAEAPVVEPVHEPTYEPAYEPVVESAPAPVVAAEVPAQPEPLLAAVPALPEEHAVPATMPETPAWPPYAQNGTTTPAPVDNPHWS
jgi:hypothetical protein